MEGNDPEITLEKVDAVRRRTGVGYRRARRVLRQCGGDVIEALVQLEEEQGGWRRRIKVRGEKMVERVRKLIRQGNVDRIIIEHRGRRLLEIPVSVGVTAAVLVPMLSTLGLIAAAVYEATITVERRPLDQGSQRPESGGAEPASETV